MKNRLNNDYLEDIFLSIHYLFFTSQVKQPIAEPKKENNTIVQNLLLLILT